MTPNTTEIEELETKYARFKRAAGTGKRGSHVWKNLADETLEELIELRKGQVEELARQHNGIKGTDHLSVSEKNEILEQYREEKAELEELRAENDE